MALALVTVYFFAHDWFASITAHVTAMMPIMLSISTACIPGFPIAGFALLLALTHGLMGVLTPYATTSGPVYLGSGYITSRGPAPRSHVRRDIPVRTARTERAILAVRDDPGG